MITLPAKNPEHFDTWDPTVLGTWESLSKKAQITVDSARSLTVYDDYLADCRTIAREEGEAGIWRLISSNSRYLTALSVLWCSASPYGLASETQLFEATRGIAAKLHELPYRPSEIALRNYYSVYAQMYDRFDRENPALVELLRKWLASEIVQLSSKKRFATSHLYQARKFLWEDNHMENIAQAAHNENKSIEGWANDAGLAGDIVGRLGDAVAMQYFREQVRTAQPNSDVNEFLEDLDNNPVLEVEQSDGSPFLYEALTLLIERPTVAPSEKWILAILRLVGDPRDSDAHPAWAWITVGTRERFVSWLAISDLKAFLEITEQYAKHDQEMARMFVDRKKFIEGIYEQGLVRRTRLFLGNKAYSAVRAQLADSGILQYVARIAGTHSTTAVVYMDLGNAHVIEGSHSWSLRAFDDLPDASILDPQKRSFTFYDLGPDMARRYVSRFEKPYFERTHQGDTWMGDVAADLKSRGVELNAVSLLSRTALRRYLELY